MLCASDNRRQARRMRTDDRRRSHRKVASNREAALHSGTRRTGNPRMSCLVLDLDTNQDVPRCRESVPTLRVYSKGPQAPQSRTLGLYEAQWAPAQAPADSCTTPSPHASYHICLQILITALRYVFCRYFLCTRCHTELNKAPRPPSQSSARILAHPPSINTSLPSLPSLSILPPPPPPVTSPGRSTRSPNVLNARQAFLGHLPYLYT
jgi:hypothetical protein